MTAKVPNPVKTTAHDPIRSVASQSGFALDCRPLLCIILAVLGGLVTLAPRTSAQGGVPLWTNRYSGPAFQGNDTTRAVAVDNSGNVFVTGQSRGVSSGYDYVTLAYSNTGLRLWTNRYSGSGGSDDFPFAVAVDSSGTVFVTGRSYALAFQNPNWTTVAYSGAGMPLWTNHYTGPGHGAAAALALAVDGGGTVFVTGSAIFSGDYSDYATVAYSRPGQPLWTNRYDGPDNLTDYATAIAVSGSGNVFVTGNSATVAYSSAGLPLWTNRYEGAGTGLGAIALDSRGNVLVTGTSGVGNTLNFVTLAYSSAGVPRWTNWCNAGGVDAGYTPVVASDSNGNVFVAGTSRLTNGVFDYATVAYSGAGIPLWTNRYNGPGNNEDVASSLAVDRCGNVFVTGRSRGAGNGIGLATVAYSGAGVALWTNRYEPLDLNAVYDYAHLAVDRDGNVFVTGGLWGGSDYDYATIKYSSSIRPYLEIKKLNNQAVLTWTDSGFGLQSAPDITGTFTNIPGATSPHTNPITASQQYFRLKSN